MNAVVVRVSFNDADAAEDMLHKEVVPAVTQVPGFVAGWWTRDADKTNGLGLIVLESEEAARGVKERLESDEGPTANPAVSVQGVEVREVVANA